jgi:hypothetical protein
MERPMTCAHSGESSRSRGQCPRNLVAAVMVAVASTIAIGACGSAGTRSVVASSTCRAGDPACPINVEFAANRAIARGNLSPEHSSTSYAFVATAPARLQWTLSGPAVRVILQRPDGDTDGPGLASVIALPTTGRYVFSISSNSMAEGIYGPFRLELQLMPSE